MFTLQTSFKQLLLGGGGRGGLNPSVEVTVNSNEEYTPDFCTTYNYVQELDLCWGMKGKWMYFESRIMLWYVQYSEYNMREL